MSHDQDPNFPGRPEHDDFWEISKALIDNDKAVHSSDEFGHYMGRFVDPESCVYAARQRALRVNPEASLLQQATLSSLWIDGFMAGVQFKRNQADVDSYRRTIRQLIDLVGHDVAGPERRQLFNDIKQAAALWPEEEPPPAARGI